MDKSDRTEKGADKSDRPELTSKLDAETEITNVILFGDLLVLAKASGEIVGDLPLVSLWVQDVNPTKFLLVTPDANRRLMVECMTMAVKMEWYVLLSKAIENHLKSRAIERDEDGGRNIHFSWPNGDR